MPKRQRKRAHFKTSGASPRRTITRKAKAPVSVKVKYFYGGLALAACVVLLGNRGFRTIVAGHFQLRTLNAEMTRLEREEADLRARIDAFREDDAALERVVRKELGYRRQGEIEYRFPPPSPEERYR
jgi:cell division protein FtsB